MMKMPWTTTLVAALGAAVLLHPAAARAQGQNFNDVNGVLGASASDLVFTPVVPCRIIDTRIEGGRLVAGTPRDFEVAGPLGGQGGAPNCSVPEGPAVAVVLNFVAVGPVGNGNLRAWPFGLPVPIASVINYTTGVSIANGVVVGICDPAAGSCAKDFTVRADASDSHLVVDVMGYYSRPEPVTVPWAEVTGKPTGFADDVDNDTQYSAGTGLALSGTTFSANPAQVQSRVAASCPAGSSMRVIDQAGGVSCEPDDNTVTGIGPGLLLTGGLLSADATFLQRRVSTSCASGSSMRIIDASGLVTCEPDDNTTYTGTLGVTLTGTNFTADTAFVQRRVASSCGVGSAMRVIDANGVVTCEPDNDTTYAAGFGVDLVGTTLSANTAEMQRRVSTFCSSGITSMSEAGVASCAPRIQSGRESPTLCNTETTVVFAAAFNSTPSVTVTPQGLAGTVLPPQTYCLVDEVTTEGFNFCCFGHVTEQVSWIAMATTQ